MPSNIKPGLLHLLHGWLCAICAAHTFTLESVLSIITTLGAHKMNVITLYHQPGACSRVALNALEEVGATFTDKGLNLARGDQRAPEFLAINPKGKVPTLIFNDRVISENPAIIYFIHQQYPRAGLLPWLADSADCIRGLSDLMWCASSLHPMVRQLMKPSAFTTADEKPVWDSGKLQVDQFATQLEGVLAKQPWWYGEAWSIVDVYLWWITETAKAGHYDFSPYPNVLDFQQRIRSRPSFQRALDRELKAVIDIGMKLPPGVKL